MINTTFLKYPNIWLQYGFVIEIEPHNSSAFRFIFDFENNVVVVIRIIINDYTGSDITITNIVVSPFSEQGKGFGSIALQNFLDFAKQHIQAKNFRATQVQTESTPFWKKHGFTPCEHYYVTQDFILCPSKEKICDV